MTDKELNKWEQAINKLIELTQDNKIKWDIVNPKAYLPNIDTSNAVLHLTFEGNVLLLYRRAYMRTIQPSISYSFLKPTGPEKEIKEYLAELSVCDQPSKTVVYDFPYSELTEDLYKAAVLNAANVEELINKLLSKKD